MRSVPAPASVPVTRPVRPRRRESESLCPERVVECADECSRKPCPQPQFARCGIRTASGWSGRRRALAFDTSRWHTRTGEASATSSSMISVAAPGSGGGRTWQHPGYDHTQEARSAIRARRRRTCSSGSATGAASRSFFVYAFDGFDVTVRAVFVSTMSPRYITATRWLM